MLSIAIYPVFQMPSSQHVKNASQPQYIIPNKNWRRQFGNAWVGYPFLRLNNAALSDEELSAQFGVGQRMYLLVLSLRVKIAKHSAEESRSQLSEGQNDVEEEGEDTIIAEGGREQNQDVSLLIYTDN